MSGRTRWVVPAVLAALGIVAVLAATRWAGGGDSAAAAAPVLREEFRSTVVATGTLEAAVAYEVGPPSAQDFWNYDLTWLIPEGKWVEQGDVIARFDTTQLDDRLREHRAELETTLQEREKEQRNLDISLRQLRLDLVKAEGELKKVDLDLSVPAGLVSGIEVEQARLRKRLAERRLTFLREKIGFEQELVRSKLELLDVKREFAEGKIAYNEAVKDKFSVRAPIGGLVMYVPKRNGERWEVGESVWMMAKILEVADVSTLRVEASVLEADAATIRPGQAAEVTVDALPGLRLDSAVSEIGRIVHERSFQDPSKVFDAMLPLGETRSEALRPGMGVRVEIETARLPDRLTIPLDAVRMSDRGTFCEVLRGGVAEPREVELGPRNRRRVVVESGLEEGETVRLLDPGPRA